MARLDSTALEALFDEVADRDATDVDRYLASACSDPQVRRQVKLLLAHDRADDDHLLAPAHDLLVEAMRQRLGGANAKGNDALPERIGRFRVQERIGSGAMGVVYAGYDEVLDRRVALKLLHGETATSAWLMREGQALGRVAHPNVVTIYEVGEHDGHVFLAMELVEGPTLRAWLAEERRAFGEVLRVLLDVGRGLAAVHEAGLMHRDFKPDNVLIGRDGRPKIVDFGIAGLAEAATPERSAAAQVHSLEQTIARAGFPAGTPAYMAPEVLAGDRATAASDQWSFCAALYRAAYGRAPFPVADPSIEAYARRLTEGPADAPPRRADVPSWLAPILLRGLERDPARRFGSIAELLAAIERRLPRDPDLDPGVVRDDVRVIRVAVLLTAVVSLLAVGAGVLAVEPATMAIVSATLLATELVLISMRWRSLAQNFFGRRSAALLVGTTFVIFLHRLLALRMETQMERILVVDLLLIAMVYGFAALAIQRWIASLSVVALVAAAVGAYWPTWTIPAFLVGALGTFLVVTIDSFRQP